MNFIILGFQRLRLNNDEVLVTLYPVHPGWNQYLMRDNNSEKVKSNNVIINIDHRFMNMHVFVFPCIGAGMESIAE